MHYLNVQDVLWIHLQIAKKQGQFSFAKLEEATSYQYAYGKSHDVLAQASRFFPGFISMSPFDRANRAVALVSGIVFLELNGYHFNPKEKDLSQLLDRASSLETIEGSTEMTHESHGLACREVAKSVLAKYEKAISLLVE